MSYEFGTYSVHDADAWDRFVLEHPQGSVHLLTTWRDLQMTIPGRGEVLGFWAKKDNQLCAVVWCVRMRTGVGKTYWYYSARGPVLDTEDQELKTFFLERVRKDLSHTKALFWRCDPYWQEQDWRGIEGFFPGAQNYQPTDTLLLDLTKSEETLLQEMKRKGRYNINLAQKKDLSYHMATTSEERKRGLEIFWELNEQTTSRDGFAGHDRSYYEKFLEALEGSAEVFWLEKDTVPLAAAISTFCGKKAIYYFGASTSDPAYRNLMAPYLLQWRMIQEARKRGCLSYDFLGIAPENDPNHPYAGISEFKWKFGGARHTYAAGREYPLRPVLYRLYRFAKRLKKLRRAA